MKKWIGSLMLLLAAIIWGFAFVAQSEGMNYVGPLTFNAVRYIIGAVVLIPFIFIEKNKRAAMRKENPECKGYTKKIIFAGTGCGIILTVASLLQQYGILYTDSVGKAGFITALYIVLVPVANMLFGRRTKAIIWVSVAIAAIGLYLLCIKEGFKINAADILLIACAVAFTGHIVFIDRFVEDGFGVTVSCIQFAFAGIVCLPFSVIFEHWTFTSVLNAWLPILYTGVLSCGVAYTFQILGQIHVEPTKASLILCLESVFATVGGWLILSQNLSLREGIGCLVVFTAIILAQFSEKKEKENAPK